MHELSLLASASIFVALKFKKKRLSIFYLMHSRFLLWGANPEYRKGAGSINLSLLQALLGPFPDAEIGNSALDYARSPLSVFIEATSFSISTRHVGKAFITSPLSNGNLGNCWCFDLKEFKSGNMRSRAVLRCPQWRRDDFSVPPRLKTRPW